MNSGAPTKSRQKRHRGRLGIDFSLQSPNGVHLPPLQVASPRSPARHTNLASQQIEERTNLQVALQQRLDSSRNLLDLNPLIHTVNQSLQESDQHESEMSEESCFADAKRVLRRLGSTASAQYLGQFLIDLISSIENLAHDERRREAHAVQNLNNLAAHRLPGSLNSSQMGGEDVVISEPESSESDCASDTDTEGDCVFESEVDQAQPLATAQDLRHVPKQAVFQTARRSRQFPGSRVTPAEFVRKTSPHMPFDSLKRPLDIAFLQLKGHDEFGSALWSVVLFPKSRPSMANHEEVDAFMKWAHSRQTSLESIQAEEKNARSAPEEAFNTAKLQFKAALALKEHICFELSRFVFDKCPTTARFLHGLFLELMNIAFVTLGNAEREQEIMEQRHKNVQLELSRLNEKLTKVETSLASLEDTLAKRQQTLLRDRELIIRKRKKINLLLGAHQILIRRLVGLIHRAQEIADDIIMRSSAPVISQFPLNTNKEDSEKGIDSEGTFTLLDDIVAIVVEKYHSLPHIAKGRGRIVGGNDVTPSDDIEEQSSNRDLIVIDLADVKAAMDEYKATLLRLTRMVSAKTPDSSIGWDGLELWDQALFIPPHEEVQDLERDVQRLCLYVEERIVSKRLQHSLSNCSRTVAAQTDLSACMPKAGGQRWRALPFTSRETPAQTSSDHVTKWNWRRNRRSRQTTLRTRNEHVGYDSMKGVHNSSLPGTTTREDDHRELLNTVVPDGFRAFIRTIPHEYLPRQLSLHEVHNVISYILNSVWMLVQGDFQRPPRFSTSFTARASDDARLIPLTTFHEYVYRIFLQHFHIESVATSRILDLLVSASRLDTQSCKVQLFSRLLGISGVGTISPDSFWFVLKSLHVLQRCCASSGGYFLLDGEGDNEFVPQANAMEALSQLFSGSSNEVLKRLRLKLSGLASVYGAVWIPVYSVLMFILDEWKTGQEALQLFIEEKLFLEHASELVPFTGQRVLCNEHKGISFGEFLHGFKLLQLHVNHSEAIEAYRQLLLDSAVSISTQGPNNSLEPKANRIDRHRFYVNWMQMILHAINVSQHQMLRSHATNTDAPSVLGYSNGAIGPGVQLGAISEAMAAANQNLSFKFLLTSWEQMKPEIIRRLDTKFNDVGLQVRLVQQIEISIARQHQLQPQLRDTNIAWRSFHQIIQIAYTGTSTYNAPT